MIKSDQQRITQHKRFVPKGTHPNSSLRSELQIYSNR
ncbi:MAG: hypothetical protein DDT42_01784 [candidate division WS2 bacterium]|uniref:Uncharacterized protein n=1 Tax=Psychracetigena formicireducens TaxID=2986056 RepID=A0A9E2BI14_PSYF1|nr:hypothetical protein [Candidatus Psychracetigena formicireducens]